MGITGAPIAAVASCSRSPQTCAQGVWAVLDSCFPKLFLTAHHYQHLKQHLVKQQACSHQQDILDAAAAAAAAAVTAGAVG
jgi:hypothetical protein